MTRRFVLAEDPDDVSALIEIAKRMFQATPRGDAKARGRLLVTSAATVEIQSAPNAKDGMPGQLGHVLRRPPAPDHRR